MTVRVGINGFGRIGRNVFRSALMSFKDIEIVGINDLLEPEYLAYMLQYDSVPGRFKGGDISVEGNTLVVNGQRIRLTQERDPAALKWNEVGAEVVIESTGLFLDKASGEKHITAGAKKVLFSAPSKDDTPMFVYGVNDKTYAGQKLSISHWLAIPTQANRLCSILWSKHAPMRLTNCLPHSTQPHGNCI